MKNSLLIVFASLVCSMPSLFAAEPESAAKVDPSDWPCWRGGQRNGSVAPTGTPPTSWSDQRNVLWERPVEGRGHGSATVLGRQVFLPTADEATQTQAVVCFERSTGKQLWRSVVHQGGFKNDSNRDMNERASLASSTIATDGRRLFINFLNDNAVWTSALGLDGEILWQQRICDYVVHQGYGSSPAIYENLVIVSADNKAGGVIAGLDRRTGDVVWKHDRPMKPNYSSPIVLTAAGKPRMIMTGCDLVTSLNPLTGEVDWEIEGATTECVTTTVTDGKHVFSSGGYPKNHLAAYDAGTGRRVWEESLRVYVPSPVHRGGYLYAVLDAGIIACLDSSTGRVKWKKRLGGTFNSSPVLAGDRIYATSEDGVTHILATDPERFTEVAKNELGTSVFATPTFSGNQIFMRVARYENDQRQEYLVCIEE